MTFCSKFQISRRLAMLNRTALSEEDYKRIILEPADDRPRP